MFQSGTLLYISLGGPGAPMMPRKWVKSADKSDFSRILVHFSPSGPPNRFAKVTPVISVGYDRAVFQYPVGCVSVKYARVNGRVVSVPYDRVMFHAV